MALVILGSLITIRGHLLVSLLLLAAVVRSLLVLMNLLLLCLALMNVLGARLIEGIAYDLHGILILPLGVTRVVLLLVHNMHLLHTVVPHVFFQRICLRWHVSLLTRHLCLCLATTLSLLPVQIRII